VGGGGEGRELEGWKETGMKWQKRNSGWREKNGAWNPKTSVTLGNGYTTYVQINTAYK
jgi:hypothetical protein